MIPPMMSTARRLGKGPRRIWPRRFLPTYLNYTIGNNSKGYVADCRCRRRRPPCLSSCAAASADAPGGAAEGARGAGDVPGADYCYAAVRVDMTTYRNGDGATVGGTGADAHFLRSRAVTAPHGGVHSRRNRRRRGRLQPRRLRDREDGADRPAVVHGRHGVRPQRVQSRAVHGGATLHVSGGEGGAIAMLGPCPAAAPGGSVDKYGWDFVPERDLLVEEDAATLPRPRLRSRGGGGAPLRYLGRDACSPSTPCDECAGDCDDDSDCSPGLMCFERERGDVSRVPGCGAGGPGDIPGADYCYDPLPDDDTDSSGNDGGGGVGGATSAPPAPPSLRWLGSEGCTPTRPCGACSGDCDEGEDCLDGHSCFKRLVGGLSLVPRDAGWAGRGTSPEKLLL